MPQLAVVILNWNGIELLQKYIPSVVTHTANTTEIYVIDNASTDKSVAFLKDNYPQIKIIVNNENYGFAKGYNEGLKQIEAEYYCLLNSDVEVTPNWDISILSFMENNKDVAVCQPKLLSYLQKMSLNMPVQPVDLSISMDILFVAVVYSQQWKKIKDSTKQIKYFGLQELVCLYALLFTMI